ncbi:MAG: zinc ribbon domain-containing protein, partial [Thermoplasmata archaeon]|nr:zinc ribbon domain-containing protein [Thermoplasmata archaeon]
MPEHEAGSHAVLALEEQTYLSMAHLIKKYLDEDKSVIALVTTASGKELLEILTEIIPNVEELQDQKRIHIIDWFSYQIMQIIGMEKVDGVLLCARALLNVNMALNKALKASEEVGDRIFITDILQQSVGVFGQEATTDFMKKSLNKMHGKGISSVHLLSPSFIDHEIVDTIHSHLGQPIDVGSIIETRVMTDKMTLSDKDSIENIINFLGLSTKEVGEDEDKDEDISLYLCGNCGAFLTEHSIVCPICNADVESGAEADEGLSNCSNCGALISSASQDCGVCGEMFGDDDLARELGDEIFTEHDAFLETKPDIEFQMCMGCGTFVDPDTVTCPSCGQDISYQPGAFEEDIEDMILGERKEDRLETIPDIEFNICPTCGTFLEKGVSSCPNCDEAGSREIGLDDDLMLSLLELKRGEGIGLDDDLMLSLLEMKDGDELDELIGSGEPDILDDNEADDDLDFLETVPSIGFTVCDNCGVFIMGDTDSCPNCSTISMVEDAIFDDKVLSSELGALEKEMQVLDMLELDDDPDELIEEEIAEHLPDASLHDEDWLLLELDGLDDLAGMVQEEVSDDPTDEELDQILGLLDTDLDEGMVSTPSSLDLSEKVRRELGYTSGLAKGYTNGVSQTDGLTKGFTNGMSQTDDLAKDLTKGMGRTNGLINGTGRTNGLT